MKLEAQAGARLLQLLQTGSLPASACGKAFLKVISPLLDGGVVGWGRSGAGRVLIIRDGAALRAFYNERFPGVLPAPELESRVAGVGRFRDSKVLSNTGREIVWVRVWHEQALLKAGQQIGAAGATAAHGVFSFVLAEASQYQLSGTWILVENPAVFLAIERLGLNPHGAIYGCGRISARVLEWLARMCDSSFRLVHLPDYDPAGLSEFLRLHGRLGERVSLYLPGDLPARFERFANRGLLEPIQSQAMLARLRRSELPEVRHVVELIDRYNAGLEQEALLIEF